jgi:hypothetical protein
MESVATGGSYDLSPSALAEDKLRVLRWCSTPNGSFSWQDDTSGVPGLN